MARKKVMGVIKNACPGPAFIKSFMYEVPPGYVQVYINYSCLSFVADVSTASNLVLNEAVFCLG